MIRSISYSLVVLLSLFLLFIFFFFSQNNTKALSTLVDQSKLSHPATAQQIQSAKDALKIFLRGYEDESVGEEKQIDDFSIDNLDNATANDSGISFHVTFSVKPSKENSPYWLKGNGNALADGWIRNKEATGKATQAGEQYFVTELSITPDIQIK